MAKSTTITAEAVFSVADRLVAEGQSPSLRAVRKELGGGSFGTILPFLQSWRRARADGPTGDPNVELAPTVAAALDRLVAAAADVAEAVHEVQQSEAASRAEERAALAQQALSSDAPASGAQASGAPASGAAARLTPEAAASLREQLDALQALARDEIAKLRRERDQLQGDVAAARKEIADLKAWRQRAVAHMKSMSTRQAQS